MLKIFNKAHDPISSETHFIGACFSVLGLVWIICYGIYKQTSLPMMIATIVFGISLILLYSASSLYHYYNADDKIKLRLRKLDHSMIYVLIVGTYTPVVTFCMDAPHSYCFLGILWLVAIIGIVLKIFWINAPRAFATIIYVILGWAILFDFQSFLSMPTSCVQMIALGGISYTIGAIIYIIKKPNISDAFGFHELFHIFIMIGSFLHYLAICIFLF